MASPQPALRRPGSSHASSGGSRSSGGSSGSSSIRAAREELQRAMAEDPAYAALMQERRQQQQQQQRVERGMEHPSLRRAPPRSSGDLPPPPLPPWADVDLRASLPVPTGRPPSPGSDLLRNVPQVRACFGARARVFVRRVLRTVCTPLLYDIVGALPSIVCIL